jgi:hypothetical protein
MTEGFESAAPHPHDDDWYALVTEPRPGSASLGKALKLLAATAIVLIALNLYAPAAPTILQRVFASAILASLALPVWLWMSGVDRAIPFMPFLTLIFTYFYALPAFLLSKYTTGLFGRPVGDDFITLALGYSLLGLYCMFAGYYGPARLLFTPMLPRLNLQWRNERVVRLAALMMGVAGLLVSSSHVLTVLPGSLAQVSMFAADLSMVGICTLVALQLVGKLDWIASAFVWGGLIPARVAIGLGAGSAASGMIIGVVVAMIFASVRRSIPWKMIALGTVALFIIRPAEIPYRVATWGGRFSEASAIAKLRLYGDILYRITLGGEVKPQALIEVASLRLAQFTVFAEVIGDTPALVPFWGGESYYPILFKPIPRLILPDKPEEMSGQTFGHRYNLISIRNTGTSINLPQIVEMYANFGLIGVIVGMFIFGLIYRLLIEMFVHPGMGLGALVGAVFVSSSLFDIGSAASMVFGGIPWAIVFIAMVHLFIQFGEIDTIALGHLGSE